MEARILVPIDQCEESRDVIKVADEWAIRTQAELCFLHVSRRHLAVGENDEKTLFLQQFERSLKQLNLMQPPYEAYHRFGVAYLEILSTAERLHPDLIIMDAHSHTRLGRFFLGSNTDYVLHHCQCPVYVYKQHSREFANTIIVPIDYSEVNKSVIEQADIWAQRTGAVLYFIHTEPVSEYEEEDYAIKPDSFPEGNDLNWQEIRQRAKESRIADLHRTFENYIASCEVKSEYRPVFEFGKPYLKIQELQQETNAGLIMMAAHSHTLLNRLFVGSNTDYLLNHAPCPMYVYKENHYQSAGNEVKRVEAA